ncbi:adenylate/guanylate cyclase domain-containing protein [Lacibacterium aquatile]|uniref:Adenylate/guanylate cyclase domain-containing protein n=1 Tax=Lacibacterium aquatile TaxID=1168082 RepID=A0ABW5DR42_9PROT
MTLISPVPTAAVKSLPSAEQVVQRLRLVSGLILFAYVVTHFCNHIAGLSSLQAMNEARDIFQAIWWWPPMNVALTVSIAVHLGLALWSIYRRRTLRLRRWELAQLLLGLFIPFQLIEHVVGTRIAMSIYDINVNYDYVLLSLFADPVRPWLHTAMLSAAWLHGCIGIHYWLRIRPWYGKLFPVLQAAALIMPILVTIAFFQNGREVKVMLEHDAAWRQATFAAMRLPSDAQAAVRNLESIRDNLRMGLAGVLALTLLARQARVGLARRRSLIRIRYPGNLVVPAAKGANLLEVSRSANIPHAAVCGGRGRCSTCRVRIGKGVESLSPAQADELKVLARISAPPNVRLACQTIPSGDVEVSPVLPANVMPTATHSMASSGAGREIEIGVLFADLRGFTTMSEQRLPYDVVFILNRYFNEMGSAIEQAGGHVLQFTGDGIMALFGVDLDDPQETAIRSLNAARAMLERLKVLNADLAHDLPSPLRMGIGIHQGLCIVGDMGYGTAYGLSAVGDTVNTASRLEGLTKDYSACLVFSQAVAARSGVDTSGLRHDAITPRGRKTELGIHIVDTIEKLPATGR